MIDHTIINAVHPIVEREGRWFVEGLAEGSRSRYSGRKSGYASRSGAIAAARREAGRKPSGSGYAIDDGFKVQSRRTHTHEEGKSPFVVSGTADGVEVFSTEIAASHSDAIRQVPEFSDLVLEAVETVEEADIIVDAGSLQPKGVIFSFSSYENVRFFRIVRPTETDADGSEEEEQVAPIVRRSFGFEAGAEMYLLQSGSPVSFRKPEALASQVVERARSILDPDATRDLQVWHDEDENRLVIEFRGEAAEMAACESRSLIATDIYLSDFRESLHDRDARMAAAIATSRLVYMTGRDDDAMIAVSRVADEIVEEDPQSTLLDRFSEIDPEIETKTIALEGGAGKFVIYEPHKRGRNWVARLAGKNAASMDRDFLPSRGNLIDYAAHLKPLEPFECGADYYTSNGGKRPCRYYGVVVSVNEEEFTYVPCASAAKAIKLARQAGAVA